MKKILMCLCLVSGLAQAEVLSFAVGDIAVMQKNADGS